MKLYMAVTADEYELPLMVTNSAAFLAETFGIKLNTVYIEIAQGANGKRRGFRFVRVEVDEDEEY